MATHPVSQEDIDRTRQALREGGNNCKAAAILGVSESTIRRRLAQASIAPKHDMVSMPSFVIDGDEEEPIETLLSRRRQAFDRKIKASQARRWFPIHVKETKAYGLLIFGDPHLDNEGANWPLLDKHIAIANMDGVYAANIGDTTDNWPWTGRLAKLWSENDMSNKSAKKLANWFMFDAGIKWLVWLLGNHDSWQGGDEFYKQLGATYVPVIDWRAQFRIVHNNGTEVKIDASHGRKGNSLYNPSHGTLRDAKFGEEADLWLTGHIHSFKLDHFEIPERNKITWLAQVRGYKFADSYALVNGFAEYQHGAAIMAIIDPESGKVQCFSDPEEGAKYLEFKRR